MSRPGRQSNGAWQPTLASIACPSPSDLETVDCLAWHIHVHVQSTDDVAFPSGCRPAGPARWIARCTGETSGLRACRVGKYGSTAQSPRPAIRQSELLASVTRRLHYPPRRAHRRCDADQRPLQADCSAVLPKNIMVSSRRRSILDDVQPSDRRGAPSRPASFVLRGDLMLL